MVFEENLKLFVIDQIRIIVFIDNYGDITGGLLLGCIATWVYCATINAFGIT